MSEEITLSATDYIECHPGCSSRDLEGYLIFEKMRENQMIAGSNTITTEDFFAIELLANALIR